MIAALKCNVKYIFFWCYRSVGFEGNIEYTKKVLRQPWNALTLQLSLLLCENKIVFSLQVYFGRSDGNNLSATLRLCLVGFSN